MGNLKSSRSPMIPAIAPQNRSGSAGRGSLASWRLIGFIDGSSKVRLVHQASGRGGLRGVAALIAVTTIARPMLNNTTISLPSAQLPWEDARNL
jgi:hypothetical protein